MWCARRFLFEDSTINLRVLLSTSACIKSSGNKGYQLVDPKLQQIVEVEENKKQLLDDFPEFYIEELSGVPEEHRKDRLVRISKPPKNAMQSGTDNTEGWLLQFDQRQRWENNLMGWISNGDPLSNLQLRFRTMEEAVAYCKRNAYPYFIEREKLVKPKNKSYAYNFSWNKRSRTSTK